MKVSKIGVEFIRMFEGFSAIPYSCAGGYKTIGFGHIIKTGEHFESLTEKDALKLLEADIDHAAQAVEKWISVPLKQNQFDALVSFTFNLGSGALQRSTLRLCVNRGEHDAVPDQLLRWVRAGGKILPGLKRRRTEEGLLYKG